MRNESFNATGTTRISASFLQESLSPKVKALAAILASFQSIPGWQLNKSHLRAVCHGASGFENAWSALLKAGILSYQRKKEENGRYFYAYSLDLARVCGGDRFVLVPNEALRSDLSLNAKWLYVICASVMTFPDFVFEAERLRRLCGFGHYCYHFAYVELRDRHWLLVERVPGQKHRRYSLTRGDRSVVASTSLMFHAQRLAHREADGASPTPALSLPERRLLTRAHYQKMTNSCAGINQSVAQAAASLLADVMDSTRAHYTIDGRVVSGNLLRQRFAALQPAVLQEVLRRVQRIPGIRNLPGYLLTALYRLTEPAASPPPGPAVSYDLAAFEEMCRNDTYEDVL